MAVLEGQPDPEVALQGGADGVAGQGAQQLPALVLGRRRHGVLAERRLRAVEPILRRVA